VKYDATCVKMKTVLGYLFCLIYIFSLRHMCELCVNEVYQMCLCMFSDTSSGMVHIPLSSLGFKCLVLLFLAVW
jgi:hypothetical protein